MRILMTGGTSGIGLYAARGLLARGHDLTIGARGALPAGLSGATCTPLDLADLDSVRSFARAQSARWIDVLLLNAGLQVVEPATSRQGYEMGFAVNHLAHLLLLCELAGAMAQNGRIIVTASGTHDPAEKTGIPPPHHANARWLAYPSKDPHLDDNAGTAGRRAYAASKLCNIMAVRELHRRFGSERPDLMTAAFDPGFCPGTGLARDYRGGCSGCSAMSCRSSFAARMSAARGGRGSCWPSSRRTPNGRICAAAMSRCDASGCATTARRRWRATTTPAPSCGMTASSWRALPITCHPPKAASGHRRQSGEGLHRRG